MKKIIEVDLEEGLEKMLGKRITLFCCRYIYTGTLAGVNTTCVLLKDPKIVYETGEFSTKDWKDAQSLPHDWYVQISSIESFGELK
jgi:hypothetical protein